MQIILEKIQGGEENIVCVCVFFSKKLESFDTSVAEHGKPIGEHVHSDYCVEIFEDVGGEGWVAVDCEIT